MKVFTEAINARLTFSTGILAYFINTNLKGTNN